MEKISIALATYNGERYIERQLNSIRNQTLKPDEVVIIDDNSLDGTVEQIKKFINKYNLVNWKLYENEENIGYKKNFYNVLQKVTGDIIFLADQDDEWHIDKIEVMLKKLQKHDEIQALSSSVNLIDGSSNKIIEHLDKNYYNSNFLYLEHPPQKIEIFDMAYIGLHNVSPGCTMALRRTIVDTFLKIYDYNLPHDWFMNLIASAYGGCAFLNIPLIDYRRHDNNAIGANTKASVGILKKTRIVRINDYLFRNKAIQCVAESVGVGLNESIKRVVELNEDMIDFYRNPNPIKLFQIRTNPLYYQLAKRKVRLWEVIVSFNADIFLIKILRGKKE